MQQMPRSVYATAEEFMKDLNAYRLSNKNKWIGFAGTVNEKAVILKSYNTGYLQIFRVDGIEQAAPMDMNVRDWKAFIQTPLS